MKQEQATETDHATQSVYLIINDEDEINHLVCCRDQSWETAFCGAEAGHINMVSVNVCTMCVEIVGEEAIAEGKCPVDDLPCPAGEEFDRLIRERTWG